MHIYHHLSYAVPTFKVISDQVIKSLPKEVVDYDKFLDQEMYVDEQTLRMAGGEALMWPSSGQEMLCGSAEDTDSCAHVYGRPAT